ncbi:hypothetical protein KSS87_004276 [Heliosperma pusillum]|nr:hypothetical protein KSS87_004276 [Heliosperma pusillum]
MSIPSSSSSSTPSSTLTSKFLSLITPTKTNKTQLNPFKTHLKFPTFSPSITLKSQKTQQNRNGFMVANMGTYNVQVVVEDNEPEERLVGRFRREVFRAGVIQESKRRRFFENSQEKRKRKTREAAKRYRVRRPRPKVMKDDTVEIPKKKKVYNSDEDDWDLPNALVHHHEFSYIPMGVFLKGSGDDVEKIVASSAANASTSFWVFTTASSKLGLTSWFSGAEWEIAISSSLAKSAATLESISINCQVSINPPVDEKKNSVI